MKKRIILILAFLLSIPAIIAYYGITYNTFTSNFDYVIGLFNGTHFQIEDNTDCVDCNISADNFIGNGSSLTDVLKGGTLINLKLCRYNSATDRTDCDYTDLSGGGGGGSGVWLVSNDYIALNTTVTGEKDVNLSNIFINNTELKGYLTANGFLVVSSAFFDNSYRKINYSNEYASTGYDNENFTNRLALNTSGSILTKDNMTQGNILTPVNESWWRTMFNFAIGVYYQNESSAYKKANLTEDYPNLDLTTLDDYTNINSTRNTCGMNSTNITCRDGKIVINESFMKSYTETDPIYEAEINSTAGTHNITIKGYADAQDNLQDECSEITNCVSNADPSETDDFNKGTNASGWDMNTADDLNYFNFTNSSTVNVSVCNGKICFALNISQALCIALTGSLTLCDADDATAGAGESSLVYYQLINFTLHYDARTDRFGIFNGTNLPFSNMNKENVSNASVFPTSPFFNSFWNQLNNGTNRTWGDEEGGWVNSSQHTNTTKDVNIKGNLTAGNLSFNSGTGFLGWLSHTITAVRVWTFPDKSGTIALLGDVPIYSIAINGTNSSFPSREWNQTLVGNIGNWTNATRGKVFYNLTEPYTKSSTFNMVNFSLNKTTYDALNATRFNATDIITTSINITGGRGKNATMWIGNTSIQSNGTWICIPSC